MKNAASQILASASLIALASAHGFITSPSPRMPGDAMAKACGQQMLSNQKSDNYGNVQGELQVAQDDYDAEACNIFLCKGYKYEDNTENVQQYTVGQSVDISVDIRAPHTGNANVSVVSTSSGKVIGSALKSWDVYASNSETIPEDQKEFSIEIPDVGSDCSSPGDCVIQWFWDAPDIDQTYESCIDFTVGGGSGSSGSSGNSSSGSSSGASNSSSSAAPSSSAKANQNVASATQSSAAAATTAASSSSSEEADPSCSVVYVTASAATETPVARRQRRHARAFGRQ